MKCQDRLIRCVRPRQYEELSQKTSLSITVTTGRLIYKFLPQFLKWPYHTKICKTHIDHHNKLVISPYFYRNVMSNFHTQFGSELFQSFSFVQTANTN